MSISKNEIKLINRLKIKKYRQQHQLFIVEGKKSVDEFINSNYQLHRLFTTSPETYDSMPNMTSILEGEMSKISQLSSPSSVLALFEIPQKEEIKNKGLLVALDDVNDPGNLGTIIRLCDWFGADQLICSPNTADCYHPKTVMASMGSLSRLSVVYKDLMEVISATQLPVYATALQGDNIYTTSLNKEAIVIFGNEANGISDKLLRISNKRISIPQSKKMHQVESMNVANAAAITLSELKRSELS